MNKRNALIGALATAGLIAGAGGAALAAPHDRHAQMYAQMATAQHAHAHGDHGERGQGEHGKHGKHGGMHGGMREMLKDLDLSEEQQGRIKEIMQEHKGAGREMHEEMREHYQAMREVITAERFDQVRARELANAQAERMTEMMVQRAEMMHKIHAVLTPEQRAQVAERMEKRMERMENRGKKGPQG